MSVKKFPSKGNRISAVERKFKNEEKKKERRDFLSRDNLDEEEENFFHFLSFTLCLKEKMAVLNVYRRHRDKGIDVIRLS